MKRKAIERHHKDYGGRGGWSGIEKGFSRSFKFEILGEESSV